MRISGLTIMITGFFALYALFGETGSGFAIIIGALTTLAVATYIATYLNWSDNKTHPTTTGSNSG